MNEGHRITGELTKRQSKIVVISMGIIAAISILFTTKASAFYDIDGLIRQVNQEIQNFASSFSSQINNEISTYRNNLEAQSNQEIENYKKSLADQASREVEDAKNKQIKESEARIAKEAKESNDRINRAKAKAESELEETYKSLG